MMPKKSLIAYALIISAGFASAQGVPIHDALRSIKNITSHKMDQAILEKKGIGNTERHTITTLHMQQLEAINEALESLNISSFDPVRYENLEAAPVDAAYEASAVTGDESRLFGEGRATIEQMIVETVQKHKNNPALAKAGITPVGFRAWFQALVKQESGFQISVCSHAGACGLTQIMPGTFEYLGIPESQKNDPRVQLDGGARYLLEQLNRFGSMPLALAAYNAGPGRVVEYDGIPPFEETQNYVRIITANANKYAAAMGSETDLGTMTGKEMALAELGNMADAGQYYGYGMAGQIELSARRIQTLIEQIPHTQNIREAVDLNTYMRGEITRLASMVTLMEATQRKIEAQRFAVFYQAQITDEEFLTLSN